MSCGFAYCWGNPEWFRMTGQSPATWNGSSDIYYTRKPSTFQSRTTVSEQTALTISYSKCQSDMTSQVIHTLIHVNPITNVISWDKIFPFLFHSVTLIAFLFFFFGTSYDSWWYLFISKHCILNHCTRTKAIMYINAFKTMFVSHHINLT